MDKNEPNKRRTTAPAIQANRGDPIKSSYLHLPSPSGQIPLNIKNSLVF